jgi:tetratricopeptide (TPR) repeat protein
MINYPERKDQSNRLAEIITVIDTLRKPELSQLLYRSFVQRFNEDPRAEFYAAKIDRKQVGVDSLLKEIGLQMFNDSIYRLDENIARLYVDACEAAVMAQPDLPDAPEYLHRAAETARTLRDIPKAISLYDWIIERYPNHQRGATSLFLKAFTYDNDLKNFEEARKYYEEFLQKYPNNEFVESAKFLLENLGKTEAELNEILQKKAKEQEGKESK